MLMVAVCKEHLVIHSARVVTNAVTLLNKIAIFVYSIAMIA